MLSNLPRRKQAIYKKRVNDRVIQLNSTSKPVFCLMLIIFLRFDFLRKFDLSNLDFQYTLFFLLRKKNKIIEAEIVRKIKTI